jgi:uncharacterized protein YciI
MFENLGADLTGKQTFVLDYRPGPKWATGKPLTEQNISGHMTYVQKAFQEGVLVAGGPVDAHHGRYVIAVADAKAAEAFIAKDPAVTSGIMKASMVHWQVFNHQAASR